MPVHPDLAKRLNLLRSSPTFVLRETHDDGRADVVQLPRIPNDEFTYWVAGQSRLRDGRLVPSVFVIAHGGASLMRTYWHIIGQWYDALHDDAVVGLLGRQRAALFPFDWSYAVDVSNDVFHK